MYSLRGIIVDKSTHRVEVVRLSSYDKHPNADRMKIARVFGYVCCVGIDQFKDGDLAAYIPPDSIVPDRPEYAFLKGHFRIKVRKLRGVISQGLLIPAPPGSAEGDDVAEALGITHYDPPEPASAGGEAEKPPPGSYPTYDVDAFLRYRHLFTPMELVVATEKCHGMSAKYVFIEGRIYCGSRTEWKREDDNNVLWKALRASPWLEPFCRAHPDITVYGEVIGMQDLRYGYDNGRVGFVTFDLFRGNEWVPYQEAKQIGKDLIWVPEIYCGEFDEGKILALAEGQSMISGADHIREGIVVKPLVERTSLEIGRVSLKIVSNAYLQTP
jgi:RNA ligase (TIGR02306 family)